MTADEIRRASNVMHERINGCVAPIEHLAYIHALAGIMQFTAEMAAQMAEMNARTAELTRIATAHAEHDPRT